MRTILVAITAAAMLPLGACANGGLFSQSPYEARPERRDAAERYRDDADYHCTPMFRYAKRKKKGPPHSWQALFQLRNPWAGQSSLPSSSVPE